MSTLSIHTTQNIDLEYPIAGLGDRILAFIIDALILVAYCILIAFVVFQFLSDYGRGMTEFLFFLLILPYVFYQLVCEITMNGQSLGKKLMDIKVISMDGTPATTGQYLLRWLFRLIDITLSSGICAIVTIAVTGRGQRLGDLVANTTVIKLNAHGIAAQAPVMQATSEKMVPEYPEVATLKTADIALIRDVLQNVRQTGNTMLALEASNKIEQLLHIQRKETTPLAFLEVILQDYSKLY